MDKKEKYINFIVDDLLKKTNYWLQVHYHNKKEIVEVEISFPMYNETYFFTKKDIRDGVNQDNDNGPWAIGTSDIRHGESIYGLHRKESDIVYQLYWEKLCKEIIDEGTFPLD